MEIKPFKFSNVKVSYFVFLCIYFYISIVCMCVSIYIHIYGGQKGEKEFF